MRIGIVTTNEVQKALFVELLSPLVGELKHYGVLQAKAGELQNSNVDLLIVDLSDPSIIDCPEVSEALEKEDPICLMHERELYAMSPAERMAWRNTTLEAIKTALPAAAEELNNRRDEADNKNVPDIWIIGASSGGPHALKEFFNELPPLPISIMIAQHMSEDGYAHLLGRVRNIANGWSVNSAETGMRIAPNTVYLVPRARTVEVSNGMIVLQNSPNTATFNPCIDNVIRSVFQCHPRVGVIILSGMGGDGSAGIRAIKGRAKLIMAQDHESSGVKSMPDSARNTGAVQYSAPPAALASKLTALYR